MRFDRYRFHGTRTSSSGFTLIELMIAMVLGLIIIGGILALIVNGRRSYNQDELISRLQDELRFAMAQITVDVEMAGYWGALLDPSLVQLDTSLSISNDCGSPPGGVGTWTYSARTAIDFLNNPAGADAQTAFPCIVGTQFVDSTDVLAIKRIASVVTHTVTTGSADSRTGMTNGLIYLKTNNSTATLFKQAGSSNPTIAESVMAAPYQYWQYTPVIYYIRKFATVGDNVPSLCREVLSHNGGTPRFETECIARGIENMQVELGVDDDEDGIADSYVENPTAAQIATASTVRITLLARSEKEDKTYSNSKRYQLTAATSTTPGDHFYRRSLTTVVAIRNPSALRRIK